MNIEDLSRRIASLERNARRWRWSATALALTLVAIVAMAQTGKPPAEPDDIAPTTTRTPVSLAVIADDQGRESLYRMWSDGTIERTRTPIFDFRGNDKWELLRRP